MFLSLSAYFLLVCHSQPFRSTLESSMSVPHVVVDGGLFCFALLQADCLHRCSRLAVSAAQHPISLVLRQKKVAPS